MSGVIIVPDPTELFDLIPIRDVFRYSFVANSLTVPVYDEIDRAFGLKRADYLVLFCLSHISGLRAQDVANITGRPRNSISRAVNRMLADGYIQRTRDPHDGRQASLTITDTGRSLNDSIQPMFQARGEEVFGVLDAVEREQLDQLLNKLTAGLTAQLE